MMQAASKIARFFLLKYSYLHNISQQTAWLKLGRTLKQSAAVHHQLHLGWTNIAELLFGNIYHFTFMQQRFRTDGILLPNLRQALDVVRNATPLNFLVSANIIQTL